MRDPSVPIVAVRAVWVGGLRYEDARSNGVNNMVAALLTRGTSRAAPSRSRPRSRAWPASIGGFSGRNSLGVRAELLSRHWERGLEILADCLLNAAFSDEELEKERRQVLDEICARRRTTSAGGVPPVPRSACGSGTPTASTCSARAESVAGLTRRKAPRLLPPPLRASAT